MLSAETASGAWPVEAVTIMDRIASQVERDPGYRQQVSFAHVMPDTTTADALSHACASIAEALPIAGIIVFTGSGSTYSSRGFSGNDSVAQAEDVGDRFVDAFSATRQSQHDQGATATAVLVPVTIHLGPSFLSKKFVKILA